MEKTVHPHPYNNLFVKTMSIPEFVAKTIDHLSKDLKGKVNQSSYKFATESFVDEVLKPHFPDVIYLAEYKKTETFFYLLFEHKSYPEHPKVQTGRYIFNGLTLQKIKWHQQNEELRKAEKPTMKNFKYKLILPVLFYHGNEKWDDSPFHKLFDLPDDDFIKFLPDFEYILIDLDAFTDEYIEKIGDNLLASIILLLKHKGDKEFIKQHSKKIFKFVDESPNSTKTKEFLKTIVNFIYQTCKLENAEVMMIAQQLHTDAQASIESTWNILLTRGEKKGEKKGRIEGKIEGKKETAIIKDLEFTLNLLKKFPEWSNQELAEIANVEPTYIQKVRTAFTQPKEEEIKKFVKELYNDFSDMNDKKWEDIEAWGITLWKNFHDKGDKKKQAEKNPPAEK